MSSTMFLTSYWAFKDDPLITYEQFRSICQALGVIVAVATVSFLVKLFVVRRKTLKMRRQGYAMPPLNPIFGHLLFLKKIMSKLPSDAHPHYLPDQIRRALPDLGPIYYIDAWPFMSPTLVVTSPSTMSQITQEHVLPKFPAIRDFLSPLTGGVDLVSMDGQQWKTWRGVFNPGFSAGNLMTLVPGMVDDAKVFCEVLERRAARGKVFEMKSLTDNLAMDIIGRVVFDKELHAQVTENRMVTAMRRQMEWLTFGSEGLSLTRYNPLRPLVLWFNAREMNNYLSPELDARFAIHRAPSHDTDLSRSKSVIDLALTAYLSGKTVSGDKITLPTSSPITTHDEKPNTLSPTMKTFLMNQIKLFLFSGHDTTSSALCYTLHLLHTHPAALSRLRLEHTTVFGNAPAAATPLLRENPHLLNQLPFTTALIKESLRLFPPASSTRAGEPGFAIAAPSGTRYPTHGYLLWLVPHAVQRDPASWPRPDAFLPERWLASPGDALHPAKGAWRPFEHGARACIGQELSMLEMKIVLVMVARAFVVADAYAEVDAREGRASGPGPGTVDGERAYQVSMGQPWGNLPCRVTVVGRGGP